MAQRYKLIPESLLKRLMHQVKEPTNNSADDFLKKSLPDDLKVLLYADAARDVQIKEQRKRTAPLLVKTVDPTPGPSAKTVERMPEMLNTPRLLGIHNFLKMHGVTYNDQNEVLINGTVIPTSFYPMLVRGLQNSSLGYQPGMNEVMQVLPSFPPGISKAVMQKYQPSSSTTTVAVRSQPVVRPHMRKTKVPVSRKKNVIKQTGGKWTSL